MKTIYALSQSRGEVREIDVAQTLGLTRTSVCRAVKRLTEKVEEAARAVCVCHRTALAFLHTVLKVPYAVAKRDACYLEHLLRPQTYNRLRAYTLDRAGPGAVEAYAASIDPIPLLPDQASRLI